MLCPGQVYFSRILTMNKNFGFLQSGKVRAVPEKWKKTEPD